MSKRKSKEPSLSRFQKFEAITVHRSQLNNAPYNPRTITKHARTELKSAIRHAGLVECLVWNKRSGNLVGGHQRISILDDLERGRDYMLTVSAIDVDDVTEKKLNLLLNNVSAQGDWNAADLEKMVKELGGDLKGTGFGMVDIQALCDSAELAGLFATGKDKMATTADQIEKIKQARKESKSSNTLLDDTEFYAVLVFENRGQLDAFLVSCQLPVTERFHDGRKVQAMLRL